MGRGAGHDGSDDVQSVLSAVQCDAGLVVPDDGVETGPFRGCDVRRVGDDEVEGFAGLERGPDVGRAEAQFEPIGVRVAGVLAGQVERVRRYVEPDDAAGDPLFEERDRDGARPDADVECVGRRAPVAAPGGDEVEELLGLRSRDEGAAIRHEADAPEIDCALDVLERLPLETA